MHEAYVIGVSAGGGAALGLLAAGMLPRYRASAAVFAAVVGGLVAWPVFDLASAAAAAVGGLLVGVSAGVFTRGALRRGGTAGGTAVLLVGAAIIVFLLGLIPVVGFVEAVAIPALAVRARKRSGEKYAGLRTLAK